MSGFDQWVREAMEDPFTGTDTSLVFESVENNGGSFLRLTSTAPELAGKSGWFITAEQGFLRVSDPERDALEAKYQAYKEQA